MRLFLFWIVVLFSIVGATVTTTGTSTDSPIEATAAPPPPAPNCHEITEDMPFSDWQECVYNRTKGVGNEKRFIQLDFSEVPQAEITRFFKKKTKLIAGIKIFDHRKLETLDLGEIAEWSVSQQGVSLLEIAQNPQLKRVELKPPAIKSADAKVLIYSNPSLALSREQIKLLQIYWNESISLIEAYGGVCRFSHPYDSKRYHFPTQNHLDLCESVHGDLILKDMKLSKDVQLLDAGGCLRLEEMDLNQGKVVAAAAIQPGTLTPKCKNGLDSKILDTRCAETMRQFERYFPTGYKLIQNPLKCEKVCSKLSEGQCVILKSDLILHGSVDLDLLKDLEQIKGRLIIRHIAYKELILPKLKRIDAPKILPPADVELIQPNRDALDLGDPLLDYLDGLYALQVVDNERLASLKMPWLSWITEPTNSFIRMKSNPRLDKMDDYLPNYLIKSCLDPQDDRCHYPDYFGPEVDIEATTWAPRWYYVFLVFCTTACFAGRAALRPYDLLLAGELRMEQMEERIWTLEYQVREARRRLLARQNKLKFDQIFCAEYLDGPRYQDWG